MAKVTNDRLFVPLQQYFRPITDVIIDLLDEGKWAFV